MYLAPQVDKFVFRHIAASVDDPASLARVCRSVNSALTRDDFVYEWFRRWHGVYCPYRPWQYAAVSWHRFRKATAKQLATWMLGYIDWCSFHHKMASLHIAADGQPAKTTRDARETAPKPPKDKLRLFNPWEGHFSPFPASWPTTVTIRDAKRLLRSGQAVDALFKLCPNADALLISYATKVQNSGLLQELLAAAKKGPRRSRDLAFPVLWFRRSSVSRYYPTQLVACYQALAAGNAEILQTLLMRSTDWGIEKLFQKLMRHAVRHSNAACIRALLMWGAPPRLRVDCNLLAMAAVRTDPWAAGVVRYLMQLLQRQQQLKASSLSSAYTAACFGGNWDVLRLLLGLAAAKPLQHLPVVLQAAAAAGNVAVLQQLLDLQDNSSSSSSEEQDGPRLPQQDISLQEGSNSSNLAASHLQDNSCDSTDRPSSLQHPQQQQVEPSTAQPLLPELDWSCLTAEQIVTALKHMLGAVTGTTLELIEAASPYSAVSPTQHISDNQRAAATGYAYTAQQQQPVVMAEMLWQRLVIAAGRESEILQYMQAENIMAELLALWQSPVPEPNTRLPVPFEEFISRIHWLQQRFSNKLLKPGPIELFDEYNAYLALRAAADSGRFLSALQMVNMMRFSRALSVHIPRDQWARGERTDAANNNRYPTTGLLSSILGGRLRLAAAAADAAAVADVDRLAALTEMLFVNEQIRRDAKAAVAAAAAAGEAAAAETAAAAPSRLDRCFYMMRFSGAKGCATSASLLQQQLGIPDALLRSLLLQRYRLLARHIHCVQAAAASELRRAGPTAAAASEAASSPAAAAAVVSRERQKLAKALDVASEQMRPLLELLDQQQQQQDTYAVQSPQKFNQQQQTVPTTLRAQSNIRSPQQQRQQLLPLWQQCFLQVAAEGSIDALKLPHGAEEHITAGVHAAAAAAAAINTGSSSSGGAVQQLFSSPDFAARPAAEPPWAEGVAAAAVEAGDLDLLHWTLAECNKHKIWGSYEGAASDVLQILLQKYCTPISNYRTRLQQQQHNDMQELLNWHSSSSSSSGWYPCTSPLQQQQQHLAAGPRFARSAAESALLLLSIHPNQPDLLSHWLRSTIRPAASQPDLERAKSVVAAVAAARDLPAGARVLKPEGLRQVLNTGDLDLLMMVLCWVDRLEVTPLESDGPFVGVAAGDNDLDGAAWVPGMLGHGGEI